MNEGYERTAYERGVRASVARCLLEAWRRSRSLSLSSSFFSPFGILKQQHCWRIGYSTFLFFLIHTRLRAMKHSSTTTHTYTHVYVKIPSPRGSRRRRRRNIFISFKRKTKTVWIFPKLVKNFVSYVVYIRCAFAELLYNS